MAKPTPLFFFFFFFFVAFTGLRSAISARVLFDDEVDAESLPQTAAVAPPLDTIPSPAATFPATQIGTTTQPSTSGSQIPAITPAPTTTNEEEDDDNTTPTTPTGPLPTAAKGTDGPISFYMHDILGGSHPSARVVTGIIANSDGSGIAFSKPNDNFFPIQGTLPLLNNDNLKNIINNNNNLPFLAGFNGATQGNNLLLQNSANNGILNADDSNQPFVTAGQLPSRVTLQQLMFGSITVVDDELTESHELGSAVMGRAQGFYLASSLDGTSQTVALTALFHGGGHDHVVEDSISFFGVHRTATGESPIAVVGGTGKYENAKGYATVETIHHQEDQHTTDGVDTLIHFSVYLS
ncbi:dirigent protein 24 [Cucurbita pepo subsp. pepo]|uniref:dirigent protein 24 n=1 Tax=Cucurbita pepo subsp. pepo TaxID=3664 RepID=UPI000C9D3060|nr:dirigent protein 24 [Cucurbita pepo subsp. pepo]